MKKLFKYFFYTLFIPFWWLQLLIPRRKNIWIFGAWFGERYADNSRTLFEYIHNNEPDIRAIWLTRKSSIAVNLQSKGMKAFTYYSFNGILYSLLAKFVVVSNGKRDINSFCINGAVTTNLWHGAQMKKISCDSVEHRLSFIQKVIFKYVFPFIFEYNYSRYISTAPIFDKIICSAFDTNMQHIIKAGYPRNDVFWSDFKEPFIEDIRNKFLGCKVVTYVPTHRGDNVANVDYFDKYGFSKVLFNQYLTKNNLIFIYKGHFCVGAEQDLGDKNDELNRVIQISDDDIFSFNTLMLNTDILITDYSSAYFDFLITGRPIVFAAFDLEEYSKIKRGLYFDYHQDIVCGPVANNWSEVADSLKQILEKDNYVNDRKVKSQLYNFYYDNKNSERVFNCIYNN